MAVANSNKKIKPWHHKSSGLWCTTRKGKRYYLGRTENEAKQRAERYVKLIARGLPIPEIGQDPEEGETTAPTVKNCLLAFLQAQKKRRDNGELSQRSLSDYAGSCRDFSEFIGDDVWVSDLTPKHFMEYRDDVAKRRNLVGVGNEVTRIKTAFKWVYEFELIDKPVRFGPEFKRPKKADVKRFKKSQGKTIFTVKELRLLLAELGVHYRAMALLGINGAFGNSDCSNLLLSEVNFDKAEIEAIRNKTGEDRLVTLWPETVEALKLSLSCRHVPESEAAKNRFFVSFEGDILVNDGSEKRSSNLVTQRTTQALQRLKIHEAGKSFYWLRHTFRSVANDLEDETAIRLIMGHSDDRIDSHYIHSFPRKRVKKVTDHVRQWLFGGEE